jgi:hypothetical protein
MDQPWNEVLEENAHLFYGISNFEQLYDNLQVLTAFIDDSHGLLMNEQFQVWQFGFGNWLTFPLEVTILNDQLLIKSLAEKEETLGLNLGDTITHIDGIPARNFMVKISDKIVASTKLDSIQRLEEKLFQPINHIDMDVASKKITVRGKEYFLTRDTVNYADYYSYMQYKGKPKPDVEDMGDIGYIKLYSVTGKAYRKAITKFKEKDKVILDLRGYPNSSVFFTLAKTLSKKARPLASLFYPDYHFPGYFNDYQRDLKFYISNPVDILFLAFTKFTKINSIRY